MVSVMGFSFSGQGQNAGAGVRPAEGLERTRKGLSTRRRRSPGARSARCRRSRDAFIFPLEPAADPRAGHRHRLQVPPAGSRRHRPRGAAGGAQPVARHGGQSKVLQPACGPKAWKTRRSCSSTSTATRPAALGVSVRRDQRRPVHRARLGLCQRLPEPRPAAARGGAGRRAGAHAARRSAAASTCVNAQGKLVPLSAFATTRWIVGADADDPLQRLSGDEASPATPRRAAAPARRWTRWSGWPRNCRPASAIEWTGQSREEKLVRRAGAGAVRAFAAGRVPGAGGAVRKLIDPGGGDAGGAARRARRAARRDACAACRTTCYFKVGLIAIIGLSAKNAILIIEFAKDLQAQGKGLIEATLEAVPPALPPDPDDVARLHPRRAAAGGGHRRRLRQPARHRHRRDGRHDHRHRAGGVLRAGVLCLRPRASSKAASGSARCTRTSSAARRRGQRCGQGMSRGDARAPGVRRLLRLRAGGCMSLAPKYERPPLPVAERFRARGQAEPVQRQRPTCNGARCSSMRGSAV